MELITVIIPIRNTPVFFLKKCFDSLIKQTYKNLEIVIVDSSDNVETIRCINNYLGLFQKISLYNCESGVSLQRNLGIENANGEYIAFIDSDDYVSEDYFELLIKSLIAADADIAFPQLVKHTYDGATLTDVYSLPTEPVAGLITDSNFFVNTEKNRLVNPVKLYKKTLIGSTRFREDLSHGEDMIFNYELSKKGYRAIFCEDAIYTFTGIKGSNSARKRFNKQSIKIIDVMYKLYKINKKIYSKDNLDGIYFQFSNLFELYFAESVRLNRIGIVIKMSKFRAFYLKQHHSFKTILFILFPFTRKIVKKVLGRK